MKEKEKVPMSIFADFHWRIMIINIKGTKEMLMKTNMSYEDLHRSFIWNLANLKDESGKQVIFLDYLHSLIKRPLFKEARFLTPPAKNILRVLITREALLDKKGKEIVTPKDYVVDFLFSDDYKDTEKAILLLKQDESSFPEKKTRHTLFRV